MNALKVVRVVSDVRDASNPIRESRISDALIHE